MKNFTFLALAAFAGICLTLCGCSEKEHDEISYQPATLNEEGTYKVTRLETTFTHEGMPVGTPKSENPYPEHVLTLAGPSHFIEELTGTAKSRTTGDYIVNPYDKTLKLTINQPLVIGAGLYQIDSLTDKRLVMHLTTQNPTTNVFKTFTIRAHRY